MYRCALPFIKGQNSLIPASRDLRFATTGIRDPGSEIGMVQNGLLMIHMNLTPNGTKL
jgi:hypothetical protein